MIDEPTAMLRHMLGLPSSRYVDEPPIVPHRNYAAMPHDHPTMVFLQNSGCVVRTSRCRLYDWWETTDKGRGTAFGSVVKKKRSRSAARYSRWLSVSDALGLTFGEYLTSDHPDIVDHRRGVA